MISGCTVRITKDVVIDKYHNGYVVFPKGSLFTYNHLENVGLNKVFTPNVVIDVEQPSSVILQESEYEVVDTRLNDGKDLLLNSLKNIKRNKHEIKISRSPNIVSLIQSSDVKYIAYISIVGDNFIANISSKNQCTFSVLDFDICYTEQHSLEYNGLFKEVYNIIKPLLIIEDLND